MEELAKRAVACKGWRWMAGMLAIHPDWQGFRVSHVGLTGMHGVCRYPSRWGVERAVLALPVPTSSDVLPDLTDPATLGALLALVREALGIPYLCTSVSPEGRWWIDGYSLHDTEAEALVSALEAAP